MSLDVTLIGKVTSSDCTCPHCGNEHKRSESEELFWANVTHNLNSMAGAAGIYEALWRPEEIGATHAKHIIELLEKGLEKLKASPETYKEYDSPNGWGTYKDFVPWVEKYLNACKEHPEALIDVNR